MDQKALRISISMLWGRDPDVGTSYNNMGMVSQSEGDYDTDTALDMDQKALRIKIAGLGEEHRDVDVGTSYNNMGSQQVTKRSIHAHPGMHMQECSAVPEIMGKYTDLIVLHAR